MSTIDSSQDNGDTVLATQHQNEGKASPEQRTVLGTQAPTADVPLVDLQGSPRQQGKLSPTVQYATDRYRLARPFTTQL